MENTWIFICHRLLLWGESVMKIYRIFSIFCILLNADTKCVEQIDHSKSIYLWKKGTMRHISLSKNSFASWLSRSNPAGGVSILWSGTDLLTWKPQASSCIIQGWIWDSQMPLLVRSGGEDSKFPREQESRRMAL